MDLQLILRRSGEFAVFAALLTAVAFGGVAVLAGVAVFPAVSNRVALVTLGILVLAALTLSLRFGPPLLLSGLRHSRGAILPPLGLRVAGSVLILVALNFLWMRAISALGLVWLIGLALEAFWLAWERSPELREPDA